MVPWPIARSALLRKAIAFMISGCRGESWRIPERMTRPGFVGAKEASNANDWINAGTGMDPAGIRDDVNPTLYHVGLRRAIQW
jgi:hypothetical protein